MWTMEYFYPLSILVLTTKTCFKCCFFLGTDLASRIIHLYEEKLVNSFNEKGWTPLHLLASKPSAFGSGSHLGGWFKMIYYCKYH